MNYFNNYKKRTISSSQSIMTKVEVFDVFLDLHVRGLGMKIRGGIDPMNENANSDIFISGILAGGAVYHDARLKLGDILIAVNENSLQRVSHEEAVEYIEKAAPYVRFSVCRKTLQTPEDYEENDEENDPLLLNNENSSGDPYSTVWSDSSNNSATQVDSSISNQKTIQVPLTKNVLGFGLSLTGGIDNRIAFNNSKLYVSRVVEQGPAYMSGFIDVGDQIVAINKDNLENVSYQQAYDIIRKSPSTSVFTIRKNISWD